MEEFRYHRQKKEEYENLIKELKEDVKEIKDELNKIRNRRLSSGIINNLETRLLHTERNLDEQEQYTSRECVEIVGLSKTLKVKILKQPYLTFSKRPEHQWKNAIPM